MGVAVFIIILVKVVNNVANKRAGAYWYVFGLFFNKSLN